MRIYRKYRRTRRKAKWTAIIGALLAAGLGLGGCAEMMGPQDGDIMEIETGRNGVKAEIKDGDGDYEVYLIPNTVCRKDQALNQCADKDDYLVPPDKATPGVNK